MTKAKAPMPTPEQLAAKKARMEANKAAQVAEFAEKVEKAKAAKGKPGSKPTEATEAAKEAPGKGSQADKPKAAPAKPKATSKAAEKPASKPAQKAKAKVAITTRKPRLTEEQVKEVLHSKLSDEELAKKFDVGLARIKRVKANA